MDSKGSYNFIAKVCDSCKSGSTCSFVQLQIKVESCLPEIEINPTSIDFGAVLVGATAIKNIEITNKGCAKLEVSSIIAIPPFYSSISGPFDVNPGDSQVDPILFSPNEALPYNSVLVINTNVGSKDIPLDGSGTIIAPCTLSIDAYYDGGENTNNLPKGYDGIKYLDYGNSKDGIKIVMRASGGLPPYKWALENSNEYPDGISISEATGEIVGTPTKAKAFIVTVALSDSGPEGCFVKRDFKLQIYSKPSISTGKLPNATTGKAYKSIIEKNADLNLPLDPIKWSIVSGSLPKGLSLNEATGEISGTPDSKEAGKKFTFAIQSCTEGNVELCSDPKALGISVKGNGGGGGGGAIDPLTGLIALALAAFALSSKGKRKS